MDLPGIAGQMPQSVVNLGIKGSYSNEFMVLWGDIPGNMTAITKIAFVGTQKTWICNSPFFGKGLVPNGDGDIGIGYLPDQNTIIEKNKKKGGFTAQVMLISGLDKFHWNA